jgi:hypothetical protein
MHLWAPPGIERGPGGNRIDNRRGTARRLAERRELAPDIASRPLADRDNSRTALSVRPCVRVLPDTTSAVQTNHPARSSNRTVPL